MKKKSETLLISNPGIEINFKVINQNLGNIVCEVSLENKSKRKILIYTPLLGGNPLNEKIFFLTDSKKSKSISYRGKHLDMEEAGQGMAYLLFVRPKLDKSFFKLLDVGEILITQTSNILSYYEVHEEPKEMFIIFSCCMPLVTPHLEHYRNEEGQLVYFSLDSERIFIKKN